MGSPNEDDVPYGKGHDRSETFPQWDKMKRNHIRLIWCIALVFLLIFPYSNRMVRALMFNRGYKGPLDMAIDLPPDEQKRAIQLLVDEQKRINQEIRERQQKQVEYREAQKLPPSPEVGNEPRPLFESFVDDYKHMKKNNYDNKTQTIQEEEADDSTWTSAQFRVCVVVRTYYKQKDTLRQLLDSIIFPKEYKLATRAFVVETDVEPPPVNATTTTTSTGDNITTTDNATTAKQTESFSDLLASLARRGNQRSGDKNAVRVLDIPFQSDKTTYGYDVTEWVYKKLLNENDPNQCTHFMFTNGDNYYLPSLFPTLASEDNLLKHGFITWDFVSRYSGRVKQVQIKRDEIDLGSFIVSTKWLRTQKDALFLPKDVPIKDIPHSRLWTADYSFAYEAARELDGSQIKIMRKILFIHN